MASKSSLVVGAGAVLVSLLGLTYAPAQAGTLDDVRARDRLVCGVSDGLPGFSTRSPEGDWSGFDVDICRAVATAVLGDFNKVEYVPLSAAARFDALKTGKVDLLSRNSTWTMGRDLGGLEFAGIAYYDGQGFMVHAVDGMTSALQLDGARVCVVTGTTTEENAAAWFMASGLDVSFVQFMSRPEARMAFASNDCDVFTADASALAAERSILPTPDDYVILPEIISKEPLGPVTRDGDPAWTGLVRWTLYGLINAEERGFTDEFGRCQPWRSRSRRKGCCGAAWPRRRLARQRRCRRRQLRPDLRSQPRRGLATWDPPRRQRAVDEKGASSMPRRCSRSRP